MHTHHHHRQSVRLPESTEVALFVAAPPGRTDRVSSPLSSGSDLASFTSFASFASSPLSVFGTHVPVDFINFNFNWRVGCCSTTSSAAALSTLLTSAHFAPPKTTPVARAPLARTPICHRLSSSGRAISFHCSHDAHVLKHSISPCVRFSLFLSISGACPSTAVSSASGSKAQLKEMLSANLGKDGGTGADDCSILFLRVFAVSK